MERGEVLRSRRRALSHDVPIELVTTDGIFELDGGEWDVTNNIWLVGDDREVVVFDAAHDHQPIVDAVNGRRVRAIVLTHGHNDHINAAVPLRDAVDAPVWLHPADRMLWDVVWPDDAPDRDVEPSELDRRRRPRARRRCTRRATPPAAAASTTPTRGVVFTGDTLFCGGPGATGRSYSDEPTILRSITRSLLTLPDETVVHTGHGESTTIGAERDGVLARAAELGL